jgi:hypothetical protein
MKTNTSEKCKSEEITLVSTFNDSGKSFQQIMEDLIANMFDNHIS